MKYAQCDNCGSKDDMNFGSGPILSMGAVIQLRSGSGGNDFDFELEICESCRAQLLKKFPRLLKSIQEK